VNGKLRQTPQRKRLYIISQFLLGNDFRISRGRFFPLSKIGGGRVNTSRSVHAHRACKLFAWITPESDSSMSNRPPLQVPLGSVNFGDLKRFSPIGPDFGVDRGRPVDRYYIEGFMARNVGDVRGRVLEVANNDYTMRFGGAKVERSDVLTVETNNPKATIVGDVTHPDTLPESTFDCIIFTQTLQYTHDAHVAIKMLHRALQPGGVLLATVPGIAPMGDRPGYPEKSDRWPWYCVFTPAGLRRLLEDPFGQNAVAVESHGNIFAVTAFLYGLALEDIDVSDLNVNDWRYPVTVAGRAIKQ
jgi:SAM-dependent methyltransferase